MRLPEKRINRRAHRAILLFVSFLFALSILLCFAIDHAFGEPNHWPDYIGDMRAVPGVAGGGAIPGGTLYCPGPITDTAPMICYFQGADAWAEATGGNVVGGSNRICGGIGSRKITIADFSLCAGDTVTLAVDGTTVVLTEGAQWNRGASNAEACASLAAGIEASSYGSVVNAYCTTPNIYLQWNPSVCQNTITLSDPTCTTGAWGVDGQILSNYGTYAAPGYSFVGDTDTGMYRNAANDLRFSTSGTNSLAISASALTAYRVINANNNRIYDSIGPLQLGTAAATGHALATGDVIVGGMLEIDSVLYADNNIEMNTSTLLGANTIGTYGSISFRFAPQTPDASMLLVGTTSRAWLVAEFADRNIDFGFPQQTDPTIAIQSADAGTVTDTLFFQHDQTNGVIGTRGGMLDLNPATAAVMLPSIINAAPTEPIACNASSEGAMVYVDDTNDTQWGQICLCANLDGTGYDWRRIDPTVAACPFF